VVQLTACVAAGQFPAAAHEYVRTAPPPPPAPASDTVMPTQQMSGAAQLQPAAAASFAADEEEDEPAVLVLPAVVPLEVVDFPFEPPLLLVLDPPQATATETAIDNANMERNAFSFIASSFPIASFVRARRQRTTLLATGDDLRALCARSAVRPCRAGAQAQNDARSKRGPNDGRMIRAYEARTMSSRCSFQPRNERALRRVQLARERLSAYGGFGCPRLPARSACGV
jgi:hypothetical protein